MSSRQDVTFVGPVQLEEIKPDPENANLGTEAGNYQLEESLRRYGAARPIVLDKNNVIIAGNKTLEKAAELGIPVQIVETEGKTLIALRRSDVDLMNDPRGRELAYADNRVAEINLNWDLGQIVKDLDQGDVDLSAFWSAVELEDIKAHLQVPTLDTLEQEFGPPDDVDYYNPFHIDLPQELIDRYNALVEGVAGSDQEKFAQAVAWAEYGKETQGAETARLGPDDEGTEAAD